MFAASPATGPLRQGEILSDVIQVHVGIEDLIPEAEERTLEEKKHPQAIILTQDCDLDWDYKAREEDEQGNKLQLKVVPNVLFCELIPIETLLGQFRDAGIRGSELLRRIKQNQNERYHCFSDISPALDAASEGLPALATDFKRVFTVPTNELYFRLQYGTRRRSILQGSYLHHFSSRFGYYCLRVALPEAQEATPSTPQLSA